MAPRTQPEIRAGTRQHRCTDNVHGGFSLVELMVSLAVLLAGIGGVLGMYTTALRATAYSRHATEAAVLGEDQMERLRTLPIGDVAAGQDQVDGQGRRDPNGPFSRTWTVERVGVGDGGDGDGGGDGGVVRIVLTVTWIERGSETRSLVFAALRSR